MTIANQLKAVKAGLAPLAQSSGGKVEIAGGAASLFTLIQKNLTLGLLLCVMFKSELKRGEYEESGMVDRTFLLVASRPPGMKINPSDALVETGKEKALYDLIEEARQLVRGLSFDAETTEVTPDFKEIGIFDTQGLLVDAYQIEFSIGVQLPAIEI